MKTFLIFRYDGCFFIGETTIQGTQGAITNPAMLVYTPVQGAISARSVPGLAFITSIVFVGCSVMNVPTAAAVTELNENDPMVRSYIKTRDNYLKNLLALSN